MKIFSSTAIRAFSLVLPFAFSLGLQGCAMLAVGSPGDAGIHYTDNGARIELSASPTQVAAVTDGVLANMGIRSLGSQPQDGGSVVTGRGRVDQITIQIQPSGSGSRLEVLDATGNSNWNQDFSAKILLQIKNAV